MEAWTIVGEVFVDARFAGHNWDQELTESLNAAYSAESGENAYREISLMLSKLGDPFTRVVPARCSISSTHVPAVPRVVMPVPSCRLHYQLHCVLAHLYVYSRLHSQTHVAGLLNFETLPSPCIV